MKKTLLKILFGITGLIIIYLFGSYVGHKLFPIKIVSKVQVVDGQIKSGQSLYSALIKDYSNTEVVLLGNSLSRIYNIKKVRPGDKYRIYSSTNSRILKFIYEPSKLVSYVADRSTVGYIVSKLVPDIDERVVAVKGTIRSSLYEGMQSAGVNVRTIMNFADVFQWQIDFLTEVRPNDKFLLVYKRLYVDDEPVEDAEILLAGYKGGVGNHNAIRFKDSKFADYYDAKGNSFKKQFLKAPLNFKRISSYFSHRRRHPILKYVRPHLGIDYAAPMGTPVSSIGAGRVTYVGWKGGFGRTVVVRHNSIYTTQYGHLRRYGKGIRKGVHVNQGQVIGYVGSSGLSTGPHLDFRINKYGKPVNFLRLKLPSAKSVSKKNDEDFKKILQQARLYLEYLKSDFFLGKNRAISEYVDSEEYNALYKTKLSE